MTETCETKVVVPSEGSCESVLDELYIDLCNLIVESRIPGLNERGYGDGIHCPPLLGTSKHICDSSKSECQKHQKLIHHLLQAVRSNIFEIEVLMLPECCTESKLKERIQNKEYILMERWSVNFIYGKVESSIEVSQLLRAVRSFLHFSQISAWLSSTKGKSPSNICYWANRKLEALSAKFKHEPEVHSFPVCKISEDLYGSVKVEFPARTQYIPIIPCSKHPPLCRYSLRAINENSDLCQNIPLNPQIARHKISDNEKNELTTTNYVPEPTALILTPVSLLKTLSASIPDGSKANRVLKHSNSQDNLLSPSLSLDLKAKSIDIIPKKPSTYVCNYAETYSLGLSQENLCYDKRRLARHLHKAELKLKKLKKEVPAPLTSESLAPLFSFDLHKLKQNALKYSVTSNDASQISNSPTDVASSGNSLLKFIESSPVNLEIYPFPTSQNLRRQLKKNTKAFKRKDIETNAEKLCLFPRKKMCCDINLSSEIFKSPLPLLNCTISLPQSSNTSQVKRIVNSSGNIKFQENCTRTLANSNSCVSDEIKMFEVQQFLHQNDQHCSNLSFQTASESTMSFTQVNNCVNSTNTQNSADTLKRSVQSKIQRKSAANVSNFNSEIRLSKRTCISHFDTETNVRKRIKLPNECNKLLNLSSNTAHSASVSQFNNPMQKTFPDFKDPGKKVSLEGHLLNGHDFKKSFFQHTCSTLGRNDVLYESSRKNPKRDSITDSISNEIQNTNSAYCKKRRCMKRYHLYQRKTSPLNNLKSVSLKSRSLCHRGKKYHTQESELERSKVLFHIPDQTVFEGNGMENLNVNSNGHLTHLNINKSISPLCKSDSKTFHLPKISMNQALENTSTTVFEMFQTNKYTLLKSRKKEHAIDRILHPALLKESKLNKLFKVRKSIYRSTHSKGRNVTPESQEINVKSASSQTPCEKMFSILSSNDCQNNMVVPNTVLEKGIAQISNVSAIHSPELPSTLLSSEKTPNDECTKNGISLTYQFGSIPNPRMISLQNDHQSSFVLNTPVSTVSRNLYRIPDENLECFPKRTAKFPRGRKLLINFEESILKGCLPMVKNVKGFHAEIGASGSFCPNHLTLPADVSFYDLGNPHQGTAPYVAHVTLGNSEYYLPKKGAVQVTLFNPSETVVKMFVLNYDLSSMPPLCHTFIRQKIYYLPVGFAEEYPASQKWLRFIIHLRFASSKTGRISLHEDFKIVVLNKSNDDAASEFSQEPRELRSFLSVPMNPTFSNI